MACAGTVHAVRLQSPRSFEEIALRVNRRSFLGTCLAGAVLPSSACHASAVVSQFRPESFGAAGDGRSDDYDAFVKLANAVNAARGGTVVLSPGRTYHIGRFVAARNGVTGFAFRDCDGLAIEGNGATLSIKGDFHRADKGTRGLPGLRFDDCRRVTVRNVQLVGNVDRTTRVKALGEATTHGLLFAGCSDVLVEGVVARHFAGDGMYIREGNRAGPDGKYPASRSFTVRNSRFLYNARQGLSVIQLRGATFENCEFSYTGYVDSRGTKGRYGHHAPGAGVDIEPNRTTQSPHPVDILTGDIRFRGCRMIGNHGAAFLACRYSPRHRLHTIEQISLESCHLECDQGSPSRYGFIFDVPHGIVSGSTLQMNDKTAYLGWSRQSPANFQFIRNVVRGRNPGASRPFFILRRTAGSPTIENNQFIGEHRQPKPSRDGGWLVQLNHPDATVRDNFMFLPAAAYPASSGQGVMPAVLADVRLMESNRYQTNLRADTGAFGVSYGRACIARDESFTGTRPGQGDSLRPIELESERPFAHDSRVPWSK